MFRKVVDCFFRVRIILELSRAEGAFSYFLFYDIVKNKLSALMDVLDSTKWWEK